MPHGNEEEEDDQSRVQQLQNRVEKLENSLKNNSPDTFAESFSRFLQQTPVKFGKTNVLGTSVQRETLDQDTEATIADSPLEFTRELKESGRESERRLGEQLESRFFQSLARQPMQEARSRREQLQRARELVSQQQRINIAKDREERQRQQDIFGRRMALSKMQQKQKDRQRGITQTQQDDMLEFEDFVSTQSISGEEDVKRIARTGIEKFGLDPRTSISTVKRKIQERAQEGQGGEAQFNEDQKQQVKDALQRKLNEKQQQVGGQPLSLTDPEMENLAQFTLQRASQKIGGLDEGSMGDAVDEVADRIHASQNIVPQEELTAQSLLDNAQLGHLSDAVDDFVRNKVDTSDILGKNINVTKSEIMPTVRRYVQKRREEGANLAQIADEIKKGRPVEMLEEDIGERFKDAQETSDLLLQKQRNELDVSGNPSGDDIFLDTASRNYIKRLSDIDFSDRKVDVSGDLKIFDNDSPRERFKKRVEAPLRTYFKEGYSEKVEKTFQQVFKKDDDQLKAAGQEWMSALSEVADELDEGRLPGPLEKLGTVANQLSFGLVGSPQSEESLEEKNFKETPLGKFGFLRMNFSDRISEFLRGLEDKKLDDELDATKRRMLRVTGYDETLLNSIDLKRISKVTSRLLGIGGDGDAGEPTDEERLFKIAGAVPSQTVFNKEGTPPYADDIPHEWRKMGPTEWENKLDQIGLNGPERQVARAIYNDVYWGVNSTSPMPGATVNMQDMNIESLGGLLGAQFKEVARQSGAASISTSPISDEGLMEHAVGAETEQSLFPQRNAPTPEPDDAVMSDSDYLRGVRREIHRITNAQKYFDAMHQSLAAMKANSSAETGFEGMQHVGTGDFRLAGFIPKEATGKNPLTAQEAIKLSQRWANAQVVRDDAYEGLPPIDIKPSDLKAGAPSFLADKSWSIVTNAGLNASRAIFDNDREFSMLTDKIAGFSTGMIKLLKDRVNRVSKARIQLPAKFQKSKQQLFKESLKGGEDASP